ncbi:type II secretion system F family protein [Nocardioides sp. TRM66260-LWL]|uniref:type II secretion system F family protein n=1 Tax=Nocardioides sp. TRM66260-LWL TaxID=2874478 RepID=UPI001CC8042A|nr:type II secretion system F family protein [Nocardioides sp. TRM66260-LWL]MBZ5734309.1 type II secretion system F family protein [Nocardioides sp. TRM66260-LWL]
MLVLGLMLVVAALVLLGVALRPQDAAGGLSRSLEVLEAMTAAPADLRRQEAERPFSERVLEPLRERALTLGRRLSGGDTTERIRRRLELAGNPAGWSVDRVVSGKVLLAGLGLVLGLLASLLLAHSLPVRIGLSLLGAAAGFFALDAFLYQRAHDRGEAVQRALPDAIDLLTISVEAGLGFDAAVQQVARNTEGPLADELARVLQEMQLGQGRAEALRGLAERTHVEDLQSFVGSMVQADSFGVPIAQVLRVQSQEMRVKRRQRAEEKAQQVPVKMTVPLIFFILPCLFVAVMGPAAINIMDSFSR